MIDTQCIDIILLITRQKVNCVFLKFHGIFPIPPGGIFGAFFHGHQMLWSKIFSGTRVFRKRRKKPAAKAAGFVALCGKPGQNPGNSGHFTGFSRKSLWTNLWIVWKTDVDKVVHKSFFNNLCKLIFCTLLGKRKTLRYASIMTRWMAVVRCVAVGGLPRRYAPRNDR